MSTTVARAPRVQQSVAADAPPQRGPGWLLGLILFQILCQLALLFEAGGAVRVIVRIGAFGVSLVYLALLRGRGKLHPATGPAMVAIALVAISIFRPTTNTFIAGLAQTMMYVSTLAPLFWMRGIRMELSGLRRLFLLLWTFHTASSIFGVLQVYYPGRFQPNLSLVLAAGIDSGYTDSLNITLANGERVFRPMGLTDTPGGAAMAGFYATLFGAGLATVSKKLLPRLLFMGSMIVGMFCLYLCQVRSLLVMLGISFLVFVSMLVVRGRVADALRLVVSGALIVVVSFVMAVSVGGESVTSRLSSLVESDAQSVYYSNRGMFLEHTINDLLPEYPLGAGLGRWGMMNYYFGDNSHRDSAPIYVEIQWTAWLLDGGVPLILMYVSAIVAALFVAGRIGTRRQFAHSRELQVWAAVVLGYGFGAVAITFNAPIFLAQAGLEFWMINAALFATARTVLAAQASATPPPARVAPAAFPARARPALVRRAVAAAKDAE